MIESRTGRFPWQISSSAAAVQTDSGVHGIYDQNDQLIGFLFSYNNRKKSAHEPRHAVELLVAKIGAVTTVTDSPDPSTTTTVNGPLVQPYIAVDQVRLQVDETIQWDIGISVAGLVETLAGEILGAEEPVLDTNYAVFRVDGLFFVDRTRKKEQTTLKWTYDETAVHDQVWFDVLKTDGTETDTALLSGRQYNENTTSNGYSVHAWDELFVTSSSSSPPVFFGDIKFPLAVSEGVLQFTRPNCSGEYPPSVEDSVKETFIKYGQGGVCSPKQAPGGTEPYDLRKAKIRVLAKLCSCKLNEDQLAEQKWPRWEDSTAPVAPQDYIAGSAPSFDEYGQMVEYVNVQVGSLYPNKLDPIIVKP